MGEKCQDITIYSYVSWRPFPKGAEHLRVEQVRSVVKRPRLLAEIERALRLWLLSRRVSSVLLIDMKRETVLFCLLRSLLPTRGKVVLYDLYLQRHGRMRTALVRRALLAATTCVVWSDRQGDRCSEALALPREHFVTVRFKSTDSRFPHLERLAIGDFIFSGGNSERDYRTLFEAVKDLDIPVVVSATADAASAHGCIMPAAVPQNVQLVQALGPHFARLMASSRLVVIPLTAGRLRGAGESVCLNAMWHGRPVICADDLSAPEYINNGVEGIVVPPGDPAALREAILTLWRDREGAEAMGQAGMGKVEAEYKHEHWVARMLALAGVGQPPSGTQP